MIIPCGLTVSLAEGERTKLLNKCKELEEKLQNAGIRAKVDYRDNYSPGWKFNHWELKVSGVFRILFALRCDYFVMFVSCVMLKEAIKQAERS